MFFQVIRDGKSLGEFSETMLSEKFYSGELRATDLYRGEGMPRWRPLAEYGARRSTGAATPRPPELPFNGLDTGAFSVVLASPPVIGLSGSLITFFSVFAPAVSIPLLGTTSYLQNGRGAGAIVILSAFASVFFALTRRFKFLWVTGSTVALCLAASLVAFEYQIHQMKHPAAHGRENIFAGLESAAADATQLGWGFAVMFCGATLLLAAAAIGTGKVRLRR